MLILHGQQSRLFQCIKSGSMASANSWWLHITFVSGGCWMPLIQFYVFYISWLNLWPLWAHWCSNTGICMYIYNIFRYTYASMCMCILFYTYDVVLESTAFFCQRKHFQEPLRDGWEHQVLPELSVIVAWNWRMGRRACGCCGSSCDQARIPVLCSNLCDEPTPVPKSC